VITPPPIGVLASPVGPSASTEKNNGTPSGKPLKIAGGPETMRLLSTSRSEKRFAITRYATAPVDNGQETATVPGPPNE